MDSELDWSELCYCFRFAGFLGLSIPISVLVQEKHELRWGRIRSGFEFDSVHGAFDVDSKLDFLCFGRGFTWVQHYHQ